MEVHRLRDELSQLSETVAQLARRVAQLEGRAAPRANVADKDESEQARPRPRDWLEATFLRLAMVCFVLVGALVLRVATQQEWLSAGLGVALGLGYCVVLLVGPFLLRARTRLVQRFGAALQGCAVLLAPSIVLETFHRQDLLTAAAAGAILTGVGLAAAAVGAGHARRGVAVAGLLAALIGQAGIGLTLSGALVRGAGVVVLLGAALTLAHRSSWRELRGLTLGIGLPLLGLAVLATATREGVPSATANGLVGCAAAAWLIVAVSHVVRARRMDVVEAMWLPLVMAWFAGLSIVRLGPGAAVAALVLGLVGLVATCQQSRRRPLPSPALVGCAVTAAIAVVVADGHLDPSGVGLAALAGVLLALSRRLPSKLLDALAQLAVLFATVRFILALRAFGTEAIPDWIWPAALALLALAALHYRIAVTSEPTDRLAARLAPVSLVAATTVLLIAGDALARTLSDADAVRRLVTTALLAGVSCTGLLLRRAGRAPRGFYGLALAGVGLLTLKILLSDLFVMGGAPLLASFACLGASYVVTATALARRAPTPAGDGVLPASGPSETEPHDP